ncbi:MAG: HAMP domain-containing protein [Anaerolineae bacterium]|nr:HAMP domain-containing protein [Anaerolineae bacterium]
MESRDGSSTGVTKRGSWLRRALAQLRVKLTLPYVFLALVVAFVATFLVTSLILTLLEELFKESLIKAGREAADTVVLVERDQLADLRLIIYTWGLDEAVDAGDKDTVNLLATPLIVNERIDCAEVLDAKGNPLLAMHHRPAGGVTDYDATAGTDYGEWEVVQKVLAGEADEINGELHDKYADLIKTDWGWVFYTAGPVKVDGQVRGVVLVGTYLDNLVERLDSASLARVSVYKAGEPIATTLLDAPVLDDAKYQDILAGQEQWISRRQIEVAGEDYAEVLGAFEARYGRDLGVLSVSLPLSMVTGFRFSALWRLLIVFGVSVLVTIAVGAVLASGVVRRVRRLAVATERVAGGDLDTQVQARGYDEVSALAEDFNHMVVQLREGRMYQDLLGLTASPEIAEQLRRALAGGRVQLDPQLVTATVLFCDIRGFTRLSESREPKYVISFLNEYMRGVVNIVRGHNGVVNKFVGDAALAFFGVLPDPRPPAESAHEAVSTALAMLDYLAALNRQRTERGEEPLRVGIGVNTGSVVAGMVGSDIRLEYTVLGDAVNVAQRLSDMNKEHPQYDVFFSASTCRELGEDLKRRSVHIGEVSVKGRAAPVDVYALGSGRTS